MEQEQIAEQTPQISRTSELRSLISKRGVLKSHVTRFSNFISAFRENKRSLTELKVRLEKVEVIWADFVNIQTEIEIIDNSATQLEEHGKFEDNYFTVICKARELIIELESPGNSNVTPQVARTENINVKLPIIPLPTFSGDYRDWPHFNDTFSALVNNNSQLNDVQRFHYLRDVLKGDAKQVIESIEISDQNYKVAFELLKARFDNRKLIKRAHVASLFDIAPLIKESSHGLRKFLDDINKHLRALKNLGESVESWDILIVYLISTKLDPTTKREWEAYSAKLDEPKLNNITQFLTDRCNILETLDSSNSKLNKYNREYNTKQTRINDTRSFLSSTQTNFKCTFCKHDHSVYNCESLLKIPVKLRLEEIKKLKLCTNCLRPGHFNSECRGKSCRVCYKRHNTLLHLNDDENNETQTKSSNANTHSHTAHIPNNSQAQITDEKVAPSTSNSNSLCTSAPNSINIHTSARAEPYILLTTAMINIRTNDGNFIECRALLDNGSQSNFMTSALMTKLSLPNHKINIPVAGIGQALTNISARTKTVIKSLHNAYQKEISFLVLNRITDMIPTKSFEYTELELPQNITLADPSFNVSNEVDVLLGAGIFWELLCIGQIRTSPNGPILQKTKLGWVISGPLYANDINNIIHCNFSLHGLHTELEKFWTIENVDNYRVYSAEEAECEKVFTEQTKRDVTGRFIAHLPMLRTGSDFENSRNIAEKRFYSLERKLERDSNLKNGYVEFMREYEELGHMSKTENKTDQLTSNENSVIYYMPHHAVNKESSLTTKLRVVFDASAKSDSGLALNDILLSGPTIQDDLFSILVRFRKHTFVMIADIAKMYRQILITDEQRDMQRILWRESADQPLQDYRLNTLTYGTSPASFIATRCLHELAFLNKTQYPDASEIILKDFYMDDLITGTNSINDAIRLKTEISKILEDGCFQLRKWMSNNREILNSTESEKYLPQYIISDESCIKTLGLLWNARKDNLQILSNLKCSRTITKRTILAAVTRIFDPLGLIGPIIIKGKILLQKLWQLQISWDESVPSEIYTEWCEFIDQIQFLNDLEIPRHLALPDAINIQLHGFCDSSEAAYGACLYLKTINARGTVCARLICAKSRVAPLKCLTLPRLELCGAVLLAQLTNKVITALNMKISKTFLWTDSTIVLAWLAAPATQWKTFVSNRVAEVQNLTNIKDWHHVQSKDNPADIISRGCTPVKLLDNALWWSGPTWLQADYFEKTQLNVDIDIPERKTSTSIVMHTFTDNEIFNRFSSFNKLRRVTAYCLRFKHNTLNKMHKYHGPLTAGEIRKATNLLLKLSQNFEFQDEILQLKNNKIIAKNSRLISLNPFIDKDGLLRVGGRISKSNVTENQKFPIILSNKHPLTKLIILYEHVRNFHSGPRLTLCSLRLNYWPLKGPSTVKGVIRKCLTCFKFKPTNFNPLMADLPEARVQPTRPFYNSGVDYAGPFFIKDGKVRNRKIIKCYLCIFVCFATKAVHLELVGDLTTSSFLNALKRFTSRRGICKYLYSDNGTNFRGANNELKQIQTTILKAKDDEQINFFLSSNNITWRFLPSRSPHMGGLWEAAVKSAKFHAKRIIGNLSFTFEELSTIFVQIEGILNSRPLTPMSNEPSDFCPLTPSHFLIGDVINAIPEVDVTQTPENRLSHYEKLQRVIQHFWKRWSAEYLSTLQQRSKWKSNNSISVEVGDLVLLKNENTPPMCWPMGRITSLHPGSDKVTRVVSVKTVNGEVIRAINKICKLPIMSDDEH